LEKQCGNQAVDCQTLTVYLCIREVVEFGVFLGSQEDFHSVCDVGLGCFELAGCFEVRG